jgi:hypothetical protein
MPMSMCFRRWRLLGTALLLFFASPLVAGAEPPVAPTPDVIYLKAPAGELGFTPISGKVIAATRDYVVFRHEGAGQPRLYTRNDVRRIELATQQILATKNEVQQIELTPESKKFAPIVDRYWNEQPISQRAGGDWKALGTEVLSEFLPVGVLIGILILAGLYLVVTTALQAYERFVLESNIKRLNTAKLIEEIAKLRMEVSEMRRNLGLPVEAGTPAVAAVAAQPATRAAAQAEASVVKSAVAQLPQLHLGELIKYKLLRLRRPEELARQKQQLLTKWRTLAARDAGWILRVRYGLRAVLDLVLIVFGWLFITGFVGNIVLFLGEPDYRQGLGGGVITFMAFLALVVTIAVLRLSQGRRIRKEAYQEVFSDDAAEVP